MVYGLFKEIGLPTCLLATLQKPKDADFDIFASIKNKLSMVSVRYSVCCGLFSDFLRIVR